MEKRFETPIVTMTVTDSQAKKFKGLIIIIAAIMLVISIGSIVTNNSKTAIICSGLEVTESEQMISLLKANKIYTNYNPELGNIEVKEQDVIKAVILLSSEGYFDE